MSTFLEGFAKGFGDAKDRSLKREMFLGEQKEKRDTALRPLQAAAAEGIIQIQDTTAKLRYLEQRGIPRETINALGQDLDMLESAYEYATGDGADVPAEQLSEIYRASAIVGAPEGVDVFDYFKTSVEAYKEILDGNVSDPDTWTDPLVSNPMPRTAVVEQRTPPKPGEAGLSAVRDRTWKMQEETYNRAISGIVDSEIGRLQAMEDANTISEPDKEKLDLLLEAGSKYGTDDYYTSQLRTLYGDMAKEQITGDSSMSPDFMVEFDSNPLIKDFASPEAKASRRRSAILEQGGVFHATGTNPETGMPTTFFKMPDGKFVAVEG